MYITLSYLCFQVYQRLEKGNNADYWQDITVIVEDELHKLRKLDSRTGSQYEAAVERREGINKAVLTDVQHIFRGTVRVYGFSLPSNTLSSAMDLNFATFIVPR
jgi:hypothetical protein